MSHDWAIETKTIQCGWEPKNGEPRVLPIYQSTTYKYDSVKEVAMLFDLEAPGHMYSRISNPTCEALENKIAALEGGVGALVTSSGQNASTIAIANICSSGDHFIAVGAIYGGTVSLFTNTLKKMGIDVTLVDASLSKEELKTFFRPNTKAIFGETIANPKLDVLDFEKFSALAHEMDVPLIVDNTFATPYLCRPLELGAHIVIHSATKYLDGHAISVGGVIVDGGTFNWRNGKFPEFTEPDKSYHGIVYTEKFGNLAYIVKARVQWIRDIGSYLTPMNAFLTNLGTETLHVRMDRHCENALKLALFLEAHPKVGWVNYPALPSHKDYALAQKYLKGASGVLTFGVKGGREEGEKVMNALKLAAIVVHVADVRTGVLHPASMTHRQLSDEEQLKAGVTPDLVRVTVGLENIDDIIADFDQALRTI
ncbi:MULTISPECIES: O-acetylhomoserine aminocarboxypropyltransferase/cysteine synthase family protein [Sulfurospirillum]|uniref:O-acetylhomoserine aminocarboxypropyltransferase/cysteine synthase family protein n=1 Tax=Sulfurospirillum TaxID=57665 RepID=UPI0005AB8206|nr:MULTISPECIES: O-acetylhomoserine aminocarboxypropyltransferase/cysteine synthase family protein [Sulfurospirillum]MCP3652566.1 O-acetylhomoserine aminocarboxypropyltransferase/cysteine synthase [Sulfurospirillum sp. DNRA8]MCR1811417.1 O-acetylhomoserine aminocarboxypropyltransferase/cysteine synthase [Sulfurospirillum sp. DNRA8]MDY0264618.1 O-acetylhomoserine aminocarboxypropyltransferase/cysteine synthase [Sulfurospirillum cavolei]